MQVLAPHQWEFAFLRVLFPMLRKLLEMGGQVLQPAVLLLLLLLRLLLLDLAPRTLYFLTLYPGPGQTGQGGDQAEGLHDAR